MKANFIALVFISLISGCTSTPTGNVEAFGNATKEVTGKIDAVIKEFNEMNISNELTKLAQHKRAITTSSLSPVKDVLIGEADRRSYALYKANRALGTYAEALSGLAKSGSRDEIDLAATKLYASLHSFDEQYKALAGTEESLVADEASAGIGKAVAAAGGLYAERKRDQAIKVIVVKADPYVQTIADVIIEEFLKGVIEERIYTMKHTDLSGYIKDYNAVVATASFGEKRKMLDDIYSRYLDMQSSSASVVQAIEAVKQIKKTHSTLSQELAEDKFSSKELVRAIGRLKDLNDHYDDLARKFHQTG
jgi:hypothetical protein